ncbi:hypothetical protein DEO72_LG11g1365 [Vigna unguiculata]|uniref:Uncharacterized protein n=1 Tax=Vigna unguiculata TaxID=3917 RepID=A0A4D6NQ40_VIGUN|nr:hypothetical protein DEO72_LG11g1365 [Vigna unguiculata]
MQQPLLADSTSHHDFSGKHRHRTSDDRREMPSSSPSITRGVVDENPSFRTLSFQFLLLREASQILEPCCRTPCCSSLSFANSDHRDLDCRHDVIAACKEHCRRYQLSWSSPFLFLRQSGSLKHETLWLWQPRPSPFEERNYSFEIEFVVW